jgi:hypothetical protein
MESETLDAIAGTKNKNAYRSRQYLKGVSENIAAAVAESLDKCMFLGTIPISWRNSTIKILYKGKRALSDLIHRDCSGMHPFQSIHVSANDKSYSSNG